MPKTNINTILTNGANTKPNSVNYSSPAKKAELQELKEKSDTALRNKEVNIQKLSKFVMKK